jgi:magnesium transporter
MKILKKRFLKSVGQPPGTLVYTGDKISEETKITMIEYDEQQYFRKEVKTVDECYPCKTTPILSWINVSGLTDLKIIEGIGKHFEINSMVMEDIVNTAQRPKFEDHGDYMFIVMKMLYHDKNKEGVEIEQVSILAGSNFVITFQEKEEDVFNSIRERIQGSYGRVRKLGADYLAYALIDAVVDNYFMILEQIGEKMEMILEEELLVDPVPGTSQKIYELKRELINIRRAVWPLRESISGIGKSESKLIAESTRIFLQDLQDHTIQIIDVVESSREMISGMLDMYLSSISNKMNQTMKVLTIIATIFIPLTFIAGIYGMNFEFIPELTWRWAYPTVWAVMIGIGVSMLFFFKKKKWM